MAEKMYLTAYTYGPLPRSEFSRDGLQMNCDESVLFLGNKLLPKDTVTLIELTVNSYTPLPSIRHLPLYVGFHEEPSLGILNASCCFGSLFYKEGADYDCFEHVSGGTAHTKFTPDKIYTRIPAATEVIGIKYDPNGNEISIYRDGNLFYKFSPQYNNLATGDFYPAVFVMNNCNLDARINFGKKGLQFSQSDAMSLFGFYYKKKPLTPEILFDLIAEPDPTRIMVDDEVLIDLEVDSDILPGAMVPLYMESPQAVFTDSTQLKFDINKPPTKNYDYFGATLTSNRGLPYDEKVYVEFQVKNGVLLNGTVGIPISVGISNTKGYIMNNSLRLNMFHLKQQTYQYREVKTSVTTLLYTTSGIMTTVSPNQAMWVGVAFDLKNKEYTIFINSIPFYTVKVPSLVFTPGSGETYYFMLHQEGIEKNDDPMDGNGGLPLKGEVNFGQTPLHTVLPSGYMTLWDYYNAYYHIPILPYREICFDFMTYPYKMKLEAEILWHFRAIGQELFGQEASSNPGINQFKGTMNRVMDDEPHFVPDQGIQLLDLLMRFDNFNYTTEKLFEKEDFFRGQDIYIGNWENRVLRYVDFDFDGLNKRKLPDKDIDFVLYPKLPASIIDIDFDVTDHAYLEHVINFDADFSAMDLLLVFIVDSTVGYNSGSDTTTWNFKYGIRNDMITNEPANFYLENGSSVYIDNSNIGTFSFNSTPLQMRYLQKSLTISGKFDESVFPNVLPVIDTFGPEKTSKVKFFDMEANRDKMIERILSTTSFPVDNYTFTGTIVTNVDAISGSNVVTNIQISGITHFPIRYKNMFGDDKFIWMGDIDGSKLSFSGNTLTVNDTTLSNEYSPLAGVINYSSVTDNITYSNNIIYSGDMNLDFNAVDDLIEKINSVLPVPSDPSKYYCQFAVKVKHTKWEIIKHYAYSGDLNTITVSFATTSPILGTKTFSVGVGSINLANPDLALSRPFSDVQSNEIGLLLFAQINMGIANSATVTITLS